MRVRRVATLACVVPLLVALSTGCPRYRSDTPTAAFQAFTRALERDERSTALGLLSEPSRTALEARAQEVNKVSGGTVKADVESLFFGLPLPAAPLEDISIVTQGDNRATLKVTWPGHTGEYQMVREPSGWKLHLQLPTSNAPAGAADPR